MAAFLDKSVVSLRALVRRGTWVCGALLGALSLGLAAPPALAQQLSFAKEITDDQFTYKYEFADANRQTWRIRLRLPRAEVEASIRDIPSLDALSAQIRADGQAFQDQRNARYLEAQQGLFDDYEQDLIALAAFVNDRLPGTINYVVTREGESIRVGREGSGVYLRRQKQDIDDAIAHFDEQYALLTENYHRQLAVVQEEYGQFDVREALDDRADNIMASHYLIRDDRLGFVRLNYAAIAGEYAERLDVLSNIFLRASSDRREQLAFALRFFQSIPYDELLTRDREGIAGFVSPYALIDLNKGDCDTKTTAMAAVLGAMWPDVTTVMVLIPEHAFLGLAIPPREGDAAITVGGTTYVLVEPVGPGLFPIGHISPRSSQAIDSDAVESLVLMNQGSDL